MTPIRRPNLSGVDSSLRASDDDRDRSVLDLRDHLLAGRLTLDEFTQRVEAAITAKTHRDLVALGSDLPAVQVAGTVQRRKPVRLSAALFAHIVRRGRMRFKRRTLTVAVFADIDLDLREAEIEGLRTTVTAFIGFGNVDIYVPEGIAVDVGGIAIFGHRREWGRDLARPDAPYIHVRAFSVFGTVDIWRVPPDAHGDYGKIMRHIQRDQGELHAET
jgi:hypothetical protein